MRQSDSKRFTTRSSNTKHLAYLAVCALPVLLGGVVACGGSDDESKVDGSGATSNSGAGKPPIIIVPIGGSGNGAGGTGSVGTGGSGVYMLPPDFTKAQKGGFKLGPALDGSAGAQGNAGSSNGSSCGTQILGVVRDFKGKNEPGGQPDFESYQGDGASKGIVKDALGSDQKPVYSRAMGAFTDPQYGQQVTSPASFEQWYHSTQDVNKPFVVYFYFEPNNGVLTFQSNAFFPLDGAGWGNTPGGEGHNFGFTTEVHTQFNYKGGETFRFSGDDDLWVFINKKLALDVGGLHPEVTDQISLDAEAGKLGITVGQTYDLDLFHAERHTNASNFRVDTNLAFTNCGTIIEEPPVR